jgi:hypothetical protein
MYGPSLGRYSAKKGVKQIAALRSAEGGSLVTMTTEEDNCKWVYIPPISVFPGIFWIKIYRFVTTVH